LSCDESKIVKSCVQKYDIREVGDMESWLLTKSRIFSNLIWIDAKCAKQHVFVVHLYYLVVFVIVCLEETILFKNQFIWKEM
jgi:hypothetical protein